MQSATAYPDVVQKYLTDELQAGPLSPSQVRGAVINGFRVIPKPHKLGKWRLIVDLSYPPGCSVYDELSTFFSLIFFACNVGFFSFLRCGEFVVPDGVAFNSDIHLSIADLTFDNRSSPKVASVRIKVSKMDPFRVGVTIYLPKTSKDLCPVESLLAYLNYRGFAPGPLFHLWQATLIVSG